MNLGTIVLDALAPSMGATLRFRRFSPEERLDGGVNLTAERIAGVSEDLKVMMYGLSERKAQELFGADVRATAAAVVATELAALLRSADQVKCMVGLYAGQEFEITGRDITEAGELGGVVILGLNTMKPTTTLGVWD